MSLAGEKEKLKNIKKFFGSMDGIIRVWNLPESIGRVYKRKAGFPGGIEVSHGISYIDRRNTSI